MVGGGDSAMESVTIIHRPENLRASRIMVKRARNDPKIRWRTNAVGEEGSVPNRNSVARLRLCDIVTGEDSTLDADGDLGEIWLRGRH